MLMRSWAITTMAEREHILADFQACTGKEDIEECIVILEQHDWNLVNALQNAMADTGPGAGLEGHVGHPIQVEDASEPADHFPYFSDSVIGSPYVPPLGGHRGSPTDAAASAGPLFASAGPLFPTAGPLFPTAGLLFPTAGTSAATGDATPIRLLTFVIEYRDRTLHLVVPDNDSVAKLKDLIHQDSGVEPKSQRLCGWVKNNDQAIKDEDILKDLTLPKETKLILLSTDVTSDSTAQASNGGSPAILERLSQTFTLHIRFKDTDKVYKLNFPGSKTVQEVKGDVYAIIDVPVRNQQWTGWPEAANDDTMTLAGSGIGYPCHELEVSRVKPAHVSSHRHHHRSREVERDESATHSDDDMEMDTDDDYEDAQDSFIEDLDSDLPGPRKPEPLMPENSSSETHALESFAREFQERYGACHPVFYTGPLEKALADSLQCGARDRRLLAVYLHHDGSILSNVFCSQILCAESIVSYLSSNFILWPWDLSSEGNKARFLTLCTRHFGSTATNTVRTFKADELPLLLIISRNRGSNEVVTVIKGNRGLDELMTQLVHACEVFREQQLTEIREEDERTARERMKQEQDWAYQESLASDRAKEESRRHEEKEKLKKEEVERQKEQAERTKQEEEEAVKEAIRMSAADELPDEPPADCGQPMTTIRFRCPDGAVLVRRFLARHPLRVLLKYVTSQGYHDTDFKVLTTFPRKDLTQGDSTKTLEEMKLCPQETLILEEKS